MNTINKHGLIKGSLFALCLAGIIAASAAQGLAQTSSTGTGSGSVSVSAGAALAVPAGFTVIPANDTSRSDDQILQLNNLIVQNISGSVPGTIYASQDAGGNCREYLDVNGVSGSKAYPCPMMPTMTMLYQISVQPDTILLLKNRTRASIGDFAAGDRINVFGFKDSDTSYMQALIVRDLDKPAVGSQYVQLSNLRVVSPPAAPAPPATFSASANNIGPCIGFDSAAGVRSRAIACPPVFMDASANMGASLNNTTDVTAFRMIPAYKIEVSQQTAILNKYRQAIPLSMISANDTVNVFGYYSAGTRTVQALIVRDLSVTTTTPPPATGQASLTVTILQNRIVCIAAPCVAQVTVTLSELGGRPVASQSGALSQFTFRGLDPGTYALRVDQAGYASVQQAVSIAAGENKSVSVSLERPQQNGGVQISSLNPSVGGPGAAVTIQGSGFTPGDNAVYFGTYQVAGRLASDGVRLSFVIPSYISPCQNNDLRKTPSGFMCPAIAMQLPSGKYPVQVVNASGSSNTLLFTYTGNQTY